ncbi:MAG: HAD hydrolase-like protein [Paracoccaceae bacterium]|nr:HAD hydrolase-like protein [Paracoccaceae bacterium]
MDVFLDLDGTLTDPKPGITRSIRHALIELGLDARAEDDLTWCIGPPLLASFESLTGDPVLAPRALALYRERFSATGLYENRVYDDVPEMLAALHGAGCRLWLATSKPHVFASRITAHFGLDQWLEGLFGSELDGTRAEKTALLAHAVATTGADPARAVMLGDRKHDIVGARENRIEGVGALWGYGGEAELTGAGARTLAPNPGSAAGQILARLAVATVSD